jgi:hypothetical protein
MTLPRHRKAVLALAYLGTVSAALPVGYWLLEGLSPADAQVWAPLLLALGVLILIGASAIHYLTGDTTSE